MCLSIPAKIIKIEMDTAQVSVSGNIYRANIMLLDDIDVGDYILLHAGFAIQKISEEDAESTNRILEEIRKKSGD